LKVITSSETITVTPTICPYMLAATGKTIIRITSPAVQNTGQFTLLMGKQEFKDSDILSEVLD